MCHRPQAGIFRWKGSAWAAGVSQVLPEVSCAALNAYRLLLRPPISPRNLSTMPVFCRANLRNMVASIEEDVTERLLGDQPPIPSPWEPLRSQQKTRVRPGLQMEKRQKPVTICTVCRKPGYNTLAVGMQCPQFHKVDYKRDRCIGAMQSAVGENDWAKCPWCDTTGEDDPQQVRCSACGGAGWFFVREAPKQFR